MSNYSIQVKRTESNGCGKDGRKTIFLHPDCECFNRSRSVKFFTKEEAEQKIEKIIDKWYSPEIKRYEIDGRVIASNSAANAVKEYWRVCDPKHIGKPFEAAEAMIVV